MLARHIFASLSLQNLRCSAATTSGSASPTRQKSDAPSHKCFNHRLPR